MIRAGLPIFVGGLVASASPSAILGIVSLVLGILLALGGLAYPSVSRKSLRATIDVLLVQKGVQDSLIDDLTKERDRLNARVQTLVDLQDRKIAGEIVKSLINEGYLESRTPDPPRRRPDDGPTRR